MPYERANRTLSAYSVADAMSGEVSGVPIDALITIAVVPVAVQQDADEGLTDTEARREVEAAVSGCQFVRSVHHRWDGSRNIFTVLYNDSYTHALQDLSHVYWELKDALPNFRFEFRTVGRGESEEARGR